MALSYYGQQVSQQTLGRELRPYQNSAGDNDDKSVTLAELAERASEFGFQTYHRPAGDMELIEQFIAHDIPVITRTWLTPGEDIGHYRVVKGYDRERELLVQDDSLQGKNLEYTYEDFNELWEAFNHEFVVLISADKVRVAEQILGERVDTQSAWRLALERAQSQEHTEPSNPYARFNQLVAHYYLEEYEQTVDIYEDVADELPRRMLWYQIEPILAYYRMGEHDTVLNMSQEIFNSQNRAFSELHWLRGMIFRERGDEAAADQSFALAQRYNSSPYWEVNVE
jgi:tetratricopeptide (TPR) repeat protein